MKGVTFDVVVKIEGKKAYRHDNVGMVKVDRRDDTMTVTAGIVTSNFPIDRVEYVVITGRETTANMFRAAVERSRMPDEEGA